MILRILIFFLGIAICPLEAQRGGEVDFSVLEPIGEPGGSYAVSKLMSGELASLTLEGEELVFWREAKAAEPVTRLAAPAGVLKIDAMVQGIDGSLFVAVVFRAEGGKETPGLLRLSEDGELICAGRSTFAGNKVRTSVLHQFSDGTVLTIFGEPRKNSFTQRYLMSRPLKWKEVECKRLGNHVQARTQVHAGVAGSRDRLGLVGLKGKERTSLYFTEVGSAQESSRWSSVKGMDDFRGTTFGPDDFLRKAAIAFDPDTETYIVGGNQGVRGKRASNAAWARVNASGKMKQPAQIIQANKNNKGENASIHQLGFTSTGRVLALGNNCRRGGCGYAWMVEFGMEEDAKVEVLRLNKNACRFPYLLPAKDGRWQVIGRKEGSQITGRKYLAQKSAGGLTSLLEFSTTEEGYWWKEFANDTLFAGERLAFVLPWRGRAASHGYFKVGLNLTSLPPGLLMPSEEILVRVGKGKNEGVITVPVRGLASLGVGRLSGMVIVEAGTQIYQLPFTVPTKQGPVPRLELMREPTIRMNGQDILAGQLLRRGEAIETTVSLRNAGEVDAVATNYFWRLPFNLRLNDATPIVGLLDTIHPGDSVVLNLRFLVHNYYQHDTLTLYFYAREGKGRSSLIRGYRRPLPDAFAFPDGNGGFKQLPPEIRNYKLRSVKGGPSGGNDYCAVDPVTKITLLSPGAADQEKGVCTTSLRRFLIKAVIDSPVPLEEGDIELFRNGDVKKSFDFCLSPMVLGGNKGSGYRYEFISVVSLKANARHRMVLQANKEKEKFIVEVSDPKHRLLVFAFGAHDPNGKVFPDSAVASIAAKFSSVEEGVFFEKRIVKTRIGKTQTNASDFFLFHRKISSLNLSPNLNGENINTTDRVLVYISAKGYLLRKSASRSEFRLEFEDGNDDALDIASIIDGFGKLPCPVLVVVDACFSNSLQNELKGRVKVSESTPMTLITAADSLAWAPEGWPLLTKGIMGVFEEFDEPIPSDSSVFNALLGTNELAKRIRLRFQKELDAYNTKPKKKVLEQKIRVEHFGYPEPDFDKTVIYNHPAVAELKFNCPE